MHQPTIWVVAILALVLTLQLAPVCGQITFSKDWRAGGKRSVSLSASPSSSTSLNTNDILVADSPCDKIDEMSNAKIRDLIRKEAIALLQCELIVNKDKVRDEFSAYAGRSR